MQDEIYMARAIKLAKMGQFTTHPNPNVGCVIVKNNIVIGEGYHRRTDEPHAEIHALRMAGENAIDSTVYVTLEPCSHYGHTPPCCEAIIEAGVKQVVVAMQDPNPQVAGSGLRRLLQAGIKVSHGLMMNESEKLNKGFLKRMRTGLPYIQIKLGISLDGRTAMASGESQWITSKESRIDVQHIRAQSHAILTSYTTVFADNPALTVRWHELNKKIQTYYPKHELRQPLRIILDNKNSITPQNQIVHQPGETWFARICEDTRVWPKNTRTIIVPKDDGNRINLLMLMSLLGKHQINNVLIEAGATLVGAFIQANLVDELIIYLSPKLLGNNAKGLCILPRVNFLADAPQFKFNTIRPVGPDLCLHLTSI